MSCAVPTILTGRGASVPGEEHADLRSTGPLQIRDWPRIALTGAAYMAVAGICASPGAGSAGVACRGDIDHGRRKPPVDICDDAH